MKFFKLLQLLIAVAGLLAAYRWAYRRAYHNGYADCTVGDRYDDTPACGGFWWR